jgi:ribonuclease PH
VDCDVLQADGGTRTAAITGGFVALALAIRQLVAYKAIPRNPITGHVAAVSVGVIGGEPLLDLCYQEDSNADVDMNVVMTEAGRFVELQATGEKSTFSEEDHRRMVELARGGISELIILQKSALPSG